VINAGERFGAAGSASSAHPTAAVPLPPHGVDTLDDVAIRDLSAHRQALREGPETLQVVVRETSSIPDAPGHGPGETPLP